MKDLDRIERRLSQLSRKSAPSDLREKILTGALHHKRQTRVLSPALRYLAAACVVLIVGINLIDLNLSRVQDRKLASILGIVQSSQSRALPPSNDVMAKIMGEEQMTSAHTFITRRMGQKDRIMKLRDYLRLKEVLERWEGEI